MSPGPSFVLVARTSVASSRSHGLATALGIGTGGVFFAVAALLGLHAVLNAVPSVNLGLKLLGGAYLIFLGCMIWRTAMEPLRLSGTEPTNGSTAVSRSFWMGLLTQVSNPKAAVIYASIFAALLPREIPMSVNFLLPGLIFAVEAGWYVAVAMTLSTSSPRAFYVRSKFWIDRATGVVMMLLGVRLIAATWHI